MLLVRSAMCEQCKKDGKAYVEKVQGSKRGFEHPACSMADLRVYMVVSQDGHPLLSLLP